MESWVKPEVDFRQFVGILVLAVLAVLSACTGMPDRKIDRAAGTVSCQALLTNVDTAVREQGVKDAQDGRIDGFPYLRTNRFLSSFRDLEPGTAAWMQWLDLLLERGLEGWSLEYANLDEPAKDLLARETIATVGMQTGFSSILGDCARELRDGQLENPDAARILQANATVPDDYSIAMRTLGLYPLTALAFLKGIENWRADITEIYAKPTGSVAPTGPLMLYQAEQAPTVSQSDIAEILSDAADNPLKIPLPGEGQRETLFRQYAPRYLIDQAGPDDWPGYPTWTADNTIRIDTNRPAVFQYLSWTRYQGTNLLQLNYLVWFPARTSTGSFDLLAGKLDGLIWRVTLQPDGEPLVFDSIHACGCYHLLFAGKSVRPLSLEPGFSEPPFFPTPRQYRYSDLPLTLHLTTGNHYLVRVQPASAPAGQVRSYSRHPANALRSLPRDGFRRRCLYGPNGLVEGTERGERFLFWPMGISSAGAMRQTGHHATAFVGRRHFDDAFLFESILEGAGD